MYCGGGEAVPRAGRRGDGAARGPAGGAAWGWHRAAVWRAVRRGLGPAGVRANFFRSVSFFFFCWVRAVQFFFLGITGGFHAIVDLKDCRIGDELILFILV